MSRLHFIYFMRRSDRLAVSNLESVATLARHRPSIAVTVVDKTGSTICHERLGERPSNLSIVVRQQDETYFASARNVRIDDLDYAVQLHDDDKWNGAPKLASVTGAAVFPARHGTDAVTSPSHTNLFFGAIRGDVWNLFMSFAKEQRLPSPTLDLTLTMWLGMLDVGPWLEGYTYAYDDAHWRDYRVADRTNEGLARDIGWGDLAGTAAIRWTIFFDALGSLATLAELDSDAALTLADRQLRRTPPDFSSESDRIMVQSLPRGIRWRVSASRGHGRGFRRAGRLVAARTPSTVPRRQRTLWKLINGGFRPTSIRGLRTEVLPRLMKSAPDEIIDRAGVWQRQLEVLEDVQRSTV